MHSPAATRLEDDLIAAIGADAVRTSPEDLETFGFDALSDGHAPIAATLPRDAQEVAAIVRIARAHGQPIVARGAGTGLCGAAVPTSGGIVVSLVRMNRITAIDVRNRRARVEPGVANVQLSTAVAQYGLFFGPDPSSQGIASLGGNAATNAGGAHAYAYGSMNANILGIEFVDVDGEIHTLRADDAGYDFIGALVGSEGTLGIITALELRLLRSPRAVRVGLASFVDVESASEAVSAIVGDAIAATALEIMDRTIVRAVEAHYHVGFSVDAGAVLLVEVAGEPEDVAAGERAVAEIVRKAGALSYRSATDARERQALWASRKGAAGAIGRIAPNYYIQDATVPRTRLPQAVRAIERIAAEHDIAVGNVFHAGDGNLHPLMIFDRRDARQVEAVSHAGYAILDECIALGGTISGEHGIGYEKRETLSRVFSPDDLATMLRVRDVFDPARRFNPGKIFPSDGVCVEVSAPLPTETVPA
jgi:glycolate oxidase